GQLMNKIENMQAGDYLVLAGSIPASIPKTFYETIAAFGAERHINVIVDASGSALQCVTQNKPFLIKPNHYELGELFGEKLSTVEEIIPYGKKLIEQGV
ncbi:PfkB family carbohydrate kinase, partial [Bacillus paranthracis]